MIRAIWDRVYAKFWQFCYDVAIDQELAALVKFSARILRRLM